MNTKKLLVSFVVMTSILLSLGFASAADFSNVQVTIDTIDALDNVALVSGETVAIKVYFDSDVDTSDLKIKVELEGDKVDVDAVTDEFDVEAGHRYVKVLTLKVPYELEDEVSNDAVLNLKIWGGDAVAFTDEFDVRIQRATNNVDFMSISTSDSAEAGKLFPVTVVLKNTGYNDLNDVYITVKMPELGIQKSGYFGDLVAIENDDDEDFVSGRLFLEIPYSAKSGVYSLDVAVKSDDFSTNAVTQVAVENGFSSNIFVSGNQLFITNPTAQMLVLKLMPEGNGRISDELVVIPAGSSRTVLASPSGQDFKVNVFSKDGQLLDSISVPAYSGSAGGNAVAVLTVILAIVFLVLLVVLVILVTKKPQKKEEFGESYY